MTGRHRRRRDACRCCASGALADLSAARTLLACPGEVPERLNGHDWKSCDGGQPRPRVRIPPSPLPAFAGSCRYRDRNAAMRSPWKCASASGRMSSTSAVTSSASARAADAATRASTVPASRTRASASPAARASATSTSMTSQTSSALASSPWPAAVAPAFRHRGRAHERRLAALGRALQPRPRSGVAPFESDQHARVEAHAGHWASTSAS